MASRRGWWIQFGQTCCLFDLRGRTNTSTYFNVSWQILQQGKTRRFVLAAIFAPSLMTFSAHNVKIFATKFCYYQWYVYDALCSSDNRCRLFPCNRSRFSLTCKFSFFVFFFKLRLIM